MISIVIPTRNEAAIIRGNLERLLAFLHKNIHEEYRVIVADNASTDATRSIVLEVAAHEPRVELLELPEPGKGGAVLKAWTHAIQQTDSLPLTPDAFCFMDADLATDLAALPQLISAVHGGADIAIGSRHLPGSNTERGFLRQLISWCYRTLLRLLFRLHVSDPPCGFKAVNERVVRDIVPLVRDRQWFFDTELLIRAQRAGMRIAEIPVKWREPRHGGSLRKVLRITASDLRAVWLLWWSLRGTK